MSRPTAPFARAYWDAGRQLHIHVNGDAAVLAEDPYEVDPGRLGDIAILGTVYKGRWFPVAVSG